MHLPISVSDLLRNSVVESDRIEFKASWNLEPVLRTICAFASDFNNFGGGYIVIGIEEIPIHPEMLPTVTSEAQVEAQVKFTNTELKILGICQIKPSSNKEIFTALGYGSLSGNVKKALRRLKELGTIAYTIPDKPESQNQQYTLTEHSKKILTWIYKKKCQ